MSSQIKGLKVTKGQIFWYVEYKIGDGAYKKDSRHATYEAAAERCAVLVKQGGAA